MAQEATQTQNCLQGCGVMLMNRQLVANLIDSKYAGYTAETLAKESMKHSILWWNGKFSIEWQHKLSKDLRT